MATVASAVPAPDEARGETPTRRGFQVHKPGEGYATRLGMMLVVFAYSIFACYHWFYNWVLLRDLLPAILTDWTLDSTRAKFVAWGGTILLAGVGSLTGYYYIYVKRESAEFLIKTDGELAKVTWPAIVPWFKATTQVWGATYVVLIVVFSLTAYVFCVDWVFQEMAQDWFYGRKEGGHTVSYCVAVAAVGILGSLVWRWKKNS